MKIKMVIAALLVVSLSLSAVARPLAAQDDDATAALKITEEEEREVTAVAERFVRRMQVTNDLAPLLGEMFVSDYEWRLRQEAFNNSLPLLSSEAVRQSSREELARYKLALNNSLYLAGLFYFSYKTSGPTEDAKDDYKLVFPPDVVELCQSDPILKVLFEGESDGRAEGSPQPDATAEKPDAGEGEDEPIRNVEQLRAFTSTLERAIILARKHLGASPTGPAYLARHEGADEEENWKAERDAMEPRAWALTKEFYGYPEGTRIFCADVLIFHMDLVRVDGKLRVLALDLKTD